MKICCTHPGKLGDCLYALPVIRAIAAQYGVKVDFCTSEYCTPLKRLFEYQHYISKFYVSPNYVMEHSHRGAQPWRVPVDSTTYDVVYHLGFRMYPNKPLHLFMGELVGVAVKDEIEYEYPDIETSADPYYILAPGSRKEFWEELGKMANKLPYPVFVIGRPEEYFGVGTDKTGLDFLETTTWVGKSCGYIGTPSSQLVLANGFDIPKIVLYNETVCDMRHALIRENIRYIHYG